MDSILGLSLSKRHSSALEGFGAFRAQHAESSLRQIGRREWWLWFSTFSVTTLAATAFLLSSFPSFFRHNEHFYEIRSDQARWGILCLLLLFNGWLLYRQWSFRRERRQLSGESAGPETQSAQISSPTGLDPATGLHTWASVPSETAEQRAELGHHSPG